MLPGTLVAHGMQAWCVVVPTALPGALRWQRVLCVGPQGWPAARHALSLCPAARHGWGHVQGGRESCIANRHMHQRHLLLLNAGMCQKVPAALPSPQMQHPAQPQSARPSALRVLTPHLLSASHVWCQRRCRWPYSPPPAVVIGCHCPSPLPPPTGMRRTPAPMDRWPV